MEGAPATRTVTYADRWSRRKRSIVGPLEEAAARERHERGEPYTAVLDDPERPSVVIEPALKGGVVRSRFFDDALRNYMTYVFTRPADKDGDLFLEQLTLQRYDDAGALATDEHWIFEPPNIAHVKKRDHTTREAETYDVEADLSRNCEPAPPFGEYDSISRIER